MLSISRSKIQLLCEILREPKHSSIPKCSLWKPFKMGQLLASQSRGLTGPGLQSQLIICPSTLPSLDLVPSCPQNQVQKSTTQRASHVTANIKYVNKDKHKQ